MKKLLISASVAAVFTLSGCGGGDDFREVVEETPKVRPASRIVFNPTAGQINVPSDFFFALVEQTDDGTLELPDEVAGQVNGGTPDFSNPSAALGAIDGWSTQHPFTFPTEHPAGISLSATLAPGAIRIFEGAIGGDLNDPDCTLAEPLAGCKVGDELTYGVDFITQASGNDVAIVPLKPLKGGQTYYIAATRQLTASDGQQLEGSSTYELLEQDINTLPLATESQLALQGLINSYEAVLESQGGVAKDDIIFSFTLTTQTTHDIVDTVKQLQIAPFATAVSQGVAPEAAASLLPVIAATDAPIDTAFDALATTLLGEEQFAQLSAVGLGTCEGMIAAVTNPASPLFATAAGVFPQVGGFCAASVKQGSINLPYYLDTQDPLAGRWTAACTNGLALSAIGAENIPGLIGNGTLGVGPYNDLCQAASGGQLLDLDLTNLGINDLRHVTRYSPIPAPKGRNDDGTETVSVQITVPDESVIAVLAALPGSTVQAVTKPEDGWPVVVLQHGITSKKEDFLAITAALSVAGFATAAIDHPLHGSRGFTVGDTIVNASGGFGGSTTDYLNLQSLLTSRDNLRQSIVDTMGLRLGLNAVADLTGGSVDLDGTNVSFIGQSLGSITGIGTVATANESLGGQLSAFDGMFAFRSAVFSVPGGGIAGFLLDSPSFGPLVKGSLTAASSTDFQAFLAGYAAENQLPVEQALIPAYLAFEASLTPEQLAEVNATFASFVFAAQSILDAGDPNSYAARLAENTNVLLQEVVGGGQNDDGSTAVSDQVIPNSSVSYPTFAGTEPLISFIGLPSVSSTTMGEGAVRFITGSHSSLLSPVPSVAATTEMQGQAAAFLATGGTTIVVTDESVVAN